MRQRGPPWARPYRAASRPAHESRSRRSKRPAGSAAKGSFQAGTSGAMSARESEGEKRVSSARAAVYSSRSRTRMTLLRPWASAAQARRQQDAMPLRCQCRASAGPESRERISAILSAGKAKTTPPTTPNPGKGFKKGGPKAALRDLLSVAVGAMLRGCVHAHPGRCGNISPHGQPTDHDPPAIAACVKLLPQLPQPLPPKRPAAPRIHVNPM